MNRVEESVLQSASDWTGLAVADLSSVDLTDWRDLDRGSREEQFVGGLHVGDRDRTHDERNARVARDLHHRIARHAEEDRGVEVVGDERSILDDEQIRAGALGDLALVIE